MSVGPPLSSGRAPSWEDVLRATHDVNLAWEWKPGRDAFVPHRATRIVREGGPPASPNLGDASVVVDVAALLRRP